MDLFGIKLIGLSAANGSKLLLSLALIGGIAVIRFVIVALVATAIIRGNTFTVGDRIKMGGVQGDVIALGFLQTRILEMGQPPDVNQQETPGMWVRARQYSGRVVTVTNDKITARFLVPEHGIREVKNEMSRRILREFEAAKIEVASGTYEIVGVPPIRVRVEPPVPGA